MSWFTEIGLFGRLLRDFDRRLDLIMATLQDIQRAVQAEADIEQSVIVLLNNISAQLREARASNDPAAIQQVVDDINAHAAALAAAVKANTPVDTSGGTGATGPDAGPTGATGPTDGTTGATGPTDGPTGATGPIDGTPSP